MGTAVAGYPPIYWGELIHARIPWMPAGVAATWVQYEGGSGANNNNPLNIMGSNGPIQYNSPNDFITALANLLNGQAYSGIHQAALSGNPLSIFKAIDASMWGTHNFGPNESNAMMTYDSSYATYDTTQSNGGSVNPLPTAGPSNGIWGDITSIPGDVGSGVGNIFSGIGGAAQSGAQQYIPGVAGAENLGSAIDRINSMLSNPGGAFATFFGNLGRSLMPYLLFGAIALMALFLLLKSLIQPDVKVSVQESAAEA